MAFQVLTAIATAALLASARVTYAAGGNIAGKAKPFVCSPVQLHRGDALSISVAIPHGTDLCIRSPRNEFFFVYSCDERIRSSAWKNVECEAFATLSRISIDTGSFETAAATPGAERRRVFSASGAYTILLARNR